MSSIRKNSSLEDKVGKVFLIDDAHCERVLVVLGDIGEINLYKSGLDANQDFNKQIQAVNGFNFFMMKSLVVLVDSEITLQTLYTWSSEFVKKYSLTLSLDIINRFKAVGKEKEVVKETNKIEKSRKDTVNSNLTTKENTSKEEINDLPSPKMENNKSREKEKDEEISKLKSIINEGNYSHFNSKLNLSSRNFSLPSYARNKSFSFNFFNEKDFETKERKRFHNHAYLKFKGETLSHFPKNESSSLSKMSYSYAKKDPPALNINYDSKKSLFTTGEEKKEIKFKYSTQEILDVYNKKIKVDNIEEVEYASMKKEKESIKNPFTRIFDDKTKIFKPKMEEVKECVHEDEENLVIKENDFKAKEEEDEEEVKYEDENFIYEVMVESNSPSNLIHYSDELNKSVSSTKNLIKQKNTSHFRNRALTYSNKEFPTTFNKEKENTNTNYSNNYSSYYGFSGYSTPRNSFNSNSNKNYSSFNYSSKFLNKNRRLSAVSNYSYNQNQYKLK